MRTLTARDIRAWRKDTGMHQSDFAAMLGVSKFTISRWETGRETPKKGWLRLACAGWYAQRSLAEQIKERIAHAEHPVLQS